MVCFHFAAFVLSLTTYLFLSKGCGQSLELPKGNLLLIAFSLGGIIFTADLFYIGALQVDINSVITVTTIIALMPLVSVAIFFFWKGVIPTPTQFTGCLLAILAVYLVSKPTP